MAKSEKGAEMKMQAGAELDAIIAEKVMGWRWAVNECQYPDLNDGRVETDIGHKTFKPSRDIRAAWEVVDHFIRLHYNVQVASYIRGWTCRIIGIGHEGLADAGTAPLAICLAALQVVERK